MTPESTRADPQPQTIENEEQLEELLSRPSAQLVEMMRRVPGDIAILGIGGKMGLSLGRMAVRASQKAGTPRRIIGVSRFSNADSRRSAEEAGVEPHPCDLLNPEAVATLPAAANVIFMAGRKFGTESGQALTWASNTLLPGYAAGQYRESRIVAFSTGCVYPHTSPDSGGAAEETLPAPVGEYAQSCLGRERIFEYFSTEHNTPSCLFRLNYAIDMRYGVLHDIAQRIVAGEPVDVTMGHFNCIWQADANNAALLCLEHTATPAAPLNVTGPEILRVRDVARAIGDALGKEVFFQGTAAPEAWLSNASRAHALFGPPTVSVDSLIQWTAAWVSEGKGSLGKPTHFEATNGKF